MKCCSLILAVLFLTCSAVSIAAEIISITSRVPTGAVTPDPPYKETAEGINSWGNSAAKSTASLSGSGSRFLAGRNAGESAIQLTPSLLIPGGIYKVELTVPSLNCNNDLICNITVTGGAMYDFTGTW